MRFLDPGMARWLLVLPVALACLWIHALAKRRFRARASIGPLLTALSRLSTRRRELAALAATSVALSALVLALMRPQLFVVSRLPEYERQDLVLVLDRSASMFAEDVPPSRFARAVAEIKGFLEKKPEGIDRVGLVGFAGTSLILSHLTRDAGSLFFYLDWIKDEREAQFGTDIGKALLSARELMQKDDRPTRKIVLLISDGDDQGQELRSQLALLQKERTRVYCVGIGSGREVEIPTRNEQGKREPLLDERGRPLTTRFEEATLREIAASTGGRYFRSQTGNELRLALRDVVSRERRMIGEKTTPQYRDVHRLALAAAAVATLGMLLAL
jgi:Ca-activated chloride channel family protein